MACRLENTTQENGSCPGGRRHKARSSFWGLLVTFNELPPQSSMHHLPQSSTQGSKNLDFSSNYVGMPTITHEPIRFAIPSTDLCEFVRAFGVYEVRCPM
eukprot:scaffold426_cov319-Pavlova_lutheri.AAC.22